MPGIREHQNKQLHGITFLIWVEHLALCCLYTMVFMFEQRTYRWDKMCYAAVVHISIMMKQHSGQLLDGTFTSTLAALIGVKDDSNNKSEKDRVMLFYKLGIVRELILIFLTHADICLACVPPNLSKFSTVLVSLRCRNFPSLLTPETL